MVQFNFTYDLGVSLEQRLGFELAAAIWSQFLSDDVAVNLHIVATDTLNNGQAVGGAVPLFHEQNYGIYQEYLQQDASSAEDALVVDTLQQGNTVDVLIDDELIDGNSNILLTSAQAKALGMDESLQLDNGSEWNRDLVDSNALDGYILINNSFNWSYDYTREQEVPESYLDFLTMALHEIGHTLGFVSGLDGLLDVVDLYSGETQADGFTPLDLLRYTDASQAIENPDGEVADLTVGANASFSLDGETTLATFSTGQDTSIGGDGYQASHWERFQEALGIMDPTLGYQERTDISHLDLQAFDALGWDINYSVLDDGLDLNALYNQALQSVSEDLNIGIDAVEDAVASGQDWFTLGHGSWWQAFKEQMIELGHGSWWQEFESQLLELGHGSWWQAFDEELFTLGHGSWWQIFEDAVFDLGHGSWWQQFEQQQFNLGHGSWWQQFEPQMLEQSFGSWWQIFEQQMLALGHGSWWQTFEQQVLGLGHGSWWQAFEQQVLELGHGSWWQAFEDMVLDLGHGSWWQQFESSMMNLGHGSWWQAFELQHGSWWQVLELHQGSVWQQSEEFFSTLDENLNQDGSPNFTQELEKGHANVGVVKGGKDDDIIGGTEFQDRIKGRDGDDLIDGAGGDDVLWGDKGRDILYGQDGADALYGGRDNDLLAGENGNDQLFGESGADVLLGGAGHDVLDGGRGRDELKGGDGTDIIAGGKDDDLIDGEGGDDLVMGNEGRDRLSGGQGNDVIYGDRTLAEGRTGLATLLQEFLAKRAQTQGIGSSFAFVPNTTTTNSNGAIRIEAESMKLSDGYGIEASSSASGDNRIKANKIGTAETVFDGPAGRYMVVANYVDEADGQATATIKINGVVIDDWIFNQDDGQYHSRTITTNIALNPGDTIEIIGTQQGTEHARFDYLDFVSLENLFPTYVEEELSQEQLSEVDQVISLPSSGVEIQTIGSPTNSEVQPDIIDLSAVGKHADIIEGGTGQDFLYGDEGNDILYGEVFNALEQIATSITSVGTFDGSTAMVIEHTDDMLLNEGTLSFIFQASDNVSSEQYLFSKDSTEFDDGGHLGVYINNNRLHVRIQSNSESYLLTSDITLNENQTYDTAVTFGSRGVELWLNGQLVATDSYTGGLGNTSGGSGNREPIVLGAGQFSSGNLVADNLKKYFEGTLQNVRLLDRQIEHEEITQLQNVDKGNSTLLQTVRSSVENTPNAKVGHFDGSNTMRFDHTDAMLLNNGTLALTFQASDNVSSEQHLFSKDSSGYDNGGHLSLYVDNSRLWVRIQSDDNNYYLKSNISIQANQTYNVAMTFGDRGLELWVDGKLTDTNTYTGGLGDNSGGSGNREPIVLGASQGKSGDLIADELRDYFHGTIQRVQLFDQQLDSGDISQLSEGKSITAKTVFEGLMPTSGALEDQAFKIGSVAQVPGATLENVNTVFEAFVSDPTNDDVLVGGDGNDTLYGQWGDDTLYGDNASSASSNLATNIHFHNVDENATTGDLDFDGNDDYGELSNVETGGAMTFSAWVNYDSFNNWSRIFDFGDDSGSNNIVLANANQTNHLSLQVHDGYRMVGDLRINDFWQTNTWIHVTTTISDDGILKVYKNGALAGESTTSIVPTLQTRSNNYIGKSNWSRDGDFDGQLDRIELLNETLSEQDVSTLYEQALTDRKNPSSTGKAAAGSGAGDDVLFGNSGNDFLHGEGGDDVLNGSSFQSLGAYEQDVLVGGAGRDRFILGSEIQAFYSVAGNGDYALIEDFNSVEDSLQLHGAVKNYSQSQQNGNVHLYYQGDTAELVAVFENLSTEIDLDVVTRFV